MSGRSESPTRYAIICPQHGQVFLTKEEYDHQMRRADSRWKCPKCGKTSEFDDDNYDEVRQAEDGPDDTAEQKQWEPDPDDLLPPAKPDVMTAAGRELAARNMLADYHRLSIKAAVQLEIWHTLIQRRGPTYQATLDAHARYQSAAQKLEAHTLQIIELMGVDS